MKTTSKRASVRSAPTLSMATACGSPWPSRSKAPKMRARRRAPTSALTRERGPRSASAAAFLPGAAHRSSTSSPVRSPARAAAREACSPCTVTRPSRNAALRSTISAQSAGATRMSAAPPSRTATSIPGAPRGQRHASRWRAPAGTAAPPRERSARARSRRPRRIGWSSACAARRGSTGRPRPRDGDAGRGHGRRDRRSAGRGPRGRRSGRPSGPPGAIALDAAERAVDHLLERPRKSAVARTVSDTAACGGTRSM